MLTDDRTDFCFIILTETHLNTKRCSEMAQAMKTLSITVNRLGHWKWLTCQEAYDSVQPCPLQLAEKQVKLLQRTMRRSLISSLGSLKVQALWGGV